MDVTWKHPFTCIVAGPTSSGKTTFIKELLLKRDTFIYPKIDSVVYCYSEFQPVFYELQVELVQGLPDFDTFDPNLNNLVIIDDLMDKADKLADVFTKISHHRNISIIFILQNVFAKNSRTLSLNAHYMVLFKNPRDATQITNLAKQMYPGRIQFLQKAYTDATARAYGYIFIDLRQDTVDHMRLRTDILNE